MTAARIRPIRRIVTGHDVQGKSVILSDAPSPHAMAMAGVEGFGVTDLWKTAAVPADNGDATDPCALPITLAPPAEGMVLRLVEFPPDRDYVGRWNPDAAFASMGKSGAQALDQASRRHEGMHRTASVDYAVVIEGEIWAVLDQGETCLRPGDVLIQRGTNHAWSNRGDRPALVAFVLIDAYPISGAPGDHS